MPRKTQPDWVPKHRLQNRSGRAFVVVDGMSLGRHGTRDSQATYENVIAEWITAGRRVPERATTPGDRAVTASVLIWRFRRHVTASYPRKTQRDRFLGLTADRCTLRAIAQVRLGRTAGVTIFDFIRFRRWRRIRPGCPWLAEKLGGDNRISDAAGFTFESSSRCAECTDANPRHHTRYLGLNLTIRILVANVLSQ